MAKYLANNSGKIKEVQPIVTSAGAGDAGKLVQLDSSGRFDISTLPIGVGAEVTVAASSENLAAGNWVNLYSNAGTINVRKADATANTKPCNGFVIASVTSPANATVYHISNKNTGVTGLTVGADYFLDTTSGAGNVTAPSATGNVVQYLGRAETSTAIVLVSGTYDFELI